MGNILVFHHSLVFPKVKSQPILCEFPPQFPLPGEPPFSDSLTANSLITEVSASERLSLVHLDQQQSKDI